MFQKLLIRIARELNKNKIPYMVIGGQAVLIYGEPRLTKDIDITVDRNIEGLKEIKNIVSKLNLKILVNDFEKFVKKTMVLPVLEEKTGIRVDFIFSYSPYEKQAIKRANHIKFRKTIVKFATLEDTIIHKIISGRPRDIEDIKSILVKNPIYDSKYIFKWLKEFDKAMNENFYDLFNEIMKTLKTEI